MKTHSSCSSCARSSKRLTTIRICCGFQYATAGNDHRLGANEAPPAVISIFLGDELTAVLDAIEKDEPYSGTEKNSDEARRPCAAEVHQRHRPTATGPRPFAFTGNKFEFRMLGSASSISMRKHRVQHRRCRIAEDSMPTASKEPMISRQCSTRHDKEDHPRSQAHHIQRQRL